MSELLQVPLEGGGVLWVRVDGCREEGPTPGPVLAGRGPVEMLGDHVVVAGETLEKALKPLADASRSMLTVLGEVAPREIEVEFGVELVAEAGAILARAGGGCHMTVRLKWGAGEGPGLAAGPKDSTGTRG